MRMSGPADSVPPQPQRARPASWIGSSARGSCGASAAQATHAACSRRSRTRGASVFAEARKTHLDGVRRLFLDHFSRDELRALCTLWEKFRHRGRGRARPGRGAGGGRARRAQARLALMAEVFRGPTGRAPRTCRSAARRCRSCAGRRVAACSIPSTPRRRQPWWRAVNDGYCAMAANRLAPRRSARRAVVAGRPAMAGVRREADRAELVPRAQRQHPGRLPGASGTGRGGERAGALLHERRAGARAVRARLVAAPRLALGRLAPLGRLLGDPRLGMTGVFLSLRVCSRPLSARRDVDAIRRRAASRPDARLRGDLPRLQPLYEWSAESSASQVWSNWSETATRSTRGPSRSDTYGARRTCRSLPARSPASRAP